ncbi:MAG: hypothetical protein KH046_00865 [Stenotrophomonas maltophilia]|uniref:hypothetical protein n=1 Tax=Stenotrophomonas maltophilia TaxID=40324 RepID=UPI0013DCB330|nr:hypothetical protein [Stenotrophomonas maltophilia]MBS4799372.1 hypothetical protein [Stenotrophomonas maltophilia]
MTELTNIVAEARRLDIVHPATQEPVGLVLILLPDSHPQVKGAARKTINDRINHRGKVGAEQIEASRISMLCASIGGWEWQGELTFHGEKPEYNLQTLQQLLKELPWVGEQVDVALTDRAEFFRRPDETVG